MTIKKYTLVNVNTSAVIRTIEAGSTDTNTIALNEARRIAREVSMVSGCNVAINNTKSGRPGADTEIYSNGYKVSLVRGNNKVGRDVYTLTFPAGCGCPKDCGCYTSGDCYGMNGCFVFENVKACHVSNWLAYNKNWRLFTAALDYLVKAYKARKVRLLVAGDADKYFPEVACNLADNNPGVTFHEFTKKYEIWNNKIAFNLATTGRKYPDNLCLLYSRWPDYEMVNPYNVPEAVFVPIGKAAPRRAYACGGCCSECFNDCAGCMAARAGEAVAIYEHSTKAASKLIPGGVKRAGYDVTPQGVEAWLDIDGIVSSARGRDEITALHNLASVYGFTYEAVKNAPEFYVTVTTVDGNIITNF